MPSIHNNRKGSRNDTAVKKVVTLVNKEKRKKHGIKRPDNKGIPNDWIEIQELLHTTSEMLRGNHAIITKGAQILLSVKDNESVPNTLKQEISVLILTSSDDVVGYKKWCDTISEKYKYRTGAVTEDELLDFWDICMDIQNTTKDAITVLQEPCIDIVTLSNEILQITKG